MSVEVSRKEIREWERVEREHNLCDYRHQFRAVECVARSYRCELINHGHLDYVRGFDCPVALLDTVQMTIDGRSMTLGDLHSRRNR